MGHHRRRAQEKRVEHFGVHRVPLLRIAHHHAHHLVVAGVTERLLKSAVHERCAQHERMKLPFDISLVRGPQVRRDPAARLFKTLEHPPQGRQQRLAQIQDCLAFRCGAFAFGPRPQAHLHLLHPAAQIEQEHLQVGHGDLELGQNFEGLLRARHEFLKISAQPPAGAGRQDGLHVEPGFLQGHFADHRAPGLQQIAHHGPPGIGRPSVEGDFEIRQRL